MNAEQAQIKLAKVDDDSFVQNIIAQANARYILFNTAESRENFPNYTIVDDKLDLLGFYYLNIGCSLAENKQIENARFPLEKGASLLEYVHGSEENKSSHSNYYGLISSLAYYAGFQYSKSFILVQKYGQDTIIAKLIASFLKRNFKVLSDSINEILVDNTYRDDYVNTLEEIDADRKIYELIIAKSLDGFVKYFQTGNEGFLIKAKNELNSLKEIAEIKSDPGIWWIIRLLVIIADGFTSASLWSVLAKYFDLKLPIVDTYIKSLVYSSPRGIYELFISQRKSLDKVLNETGNGCIVNIPTSGGKTRIAEIAIIDFLSKNPESKVLYIAPFRSLAFEVESSLVKVLDNLNISVSHLYGGQLFSKLDQFLVNESKLIIATPEKAKAILRSNREILDDIKLIIIDEGHLLGEGKRFIVNEVFYEELRFSILKNGGRFLVLSAVLPNSEDLSQWFTKSTTSVFQDRWRPSDERLGILDWTGESVNLNWESSDGERSSFNRGFIVSEAIPLTGKQRKPRYFPNNKIDAIAATAYKLKSFGPVLIFVGQKRSVFNVAESYLKCIGSADDFKWTSFNDWKAFELASIENYGINNDWLLFARRGILCHNSDLHIDCRLPMERLMRNDKPLVIICTSTLGQGVNLGVSSVIFSTVYQSGELITKRDFWNISGRSGRAFVDNEGKVLVALDSSDTSTLFSRRKIRYNRNIIRDFFDKSKMDNAESGLLWMVKYIKDLANQTGIDFSLFLELIAENKVEEIGEQHKLIEENLDLIDDALLTLHNLNNSGDTIQYDWIEGFFKGSLAYIQAIKVSDQNGSDFLSLITSRVKGIEKRIGADRNRWNSIIVSGLPLTSDLVLDSKLSEIVLDLLLTQEAAHSIDAKIAILKSIEEKLQELPVISEEALSTTMPTYDDVRSNWLKGAPMAVIMQLDNGVEIVNRLFTYKTPWILNGLAKKLKNIELPELAEIVEELSLLIESGLPNLKAVKIYQAGIRSRSAATELSAFFENELWSQGVKEYKNDILRNRDFYKALSSKETAEWIDLLVIFSGNKSLIIDQFPKFKFGDVHNETKVLVAKRISNKQYLVSPDLSFIKEIAKSDIDFSPVNDISGIFFKYNEILESWEMVVENPYVEVV